MLKDIQNLSITESHGIYDSHYFRFPYKFFKEWFENRKDELSDFDAIMMILANVNYADLPIKIAGKEMTCRRGESFRSLTSWSEIFRWNISRTRRFLLKLKDMNLLEMENVVHTTRIRFVAYDYFVGEKPKDSEDVFTESFKTFWSTYHKTTSMRETDKFAAAKIWLMLDSNEKEKATKNIRPYYYNLNNVGHCSKALSYLRNKNFNDKFYH
jgi:hypothetical protein